MRKLFIILAPLILAGCGAVLESRNQALNKGGQFYDEALNTAILWKCRASSVGSIERRYMRTDATWKIWTEECLSMAAPEIPERDETEVEALPVPR